MTISALTRRFEQVFEPRQAVVLAEVITEARVDQVKAGDFTELKSIMTRSGRAQGRTEAQLHDLAEAQRRTEARAR